jgi:hypothetical protein
MNDLGVIGPITEAEKEKLRIALGVLRSGTDYADFLQFWLSDYGMRVLSPNPPPPLLEPWPTEESGDLIVFEPADPSWVH